MGWTKQDAKRLLGRGVAIAGLGAILVFSAVAIALELLVDADELAGRIVPRASAMLNRDVSIGEASLVLLPRPGARISDVRVDNLDGFEGPPVFQADDVWMELAILPLFFGRLRVSGIRAEGPRVHLAIDERGVSNFGDLLPRRRDEGGGPETRLGFALRRIRAADATVTYADAPEARAVTLSGVALAADVDAVGPDGWRLDAETTSDSMRVLFSDPGRPPLRTSGPSAWGTLYGDQVFDRIEIEDGVLAHDGQALSVSGRISDTRGASAAVELRLTHDALPAATLARWTGRAPADADTEISGTTRLDARLTAPGPSSPSPLLRGEVVLDGVDVVRGGQAIATGLTGALEFAPDTLLMHQISGTFAGGPFELYGRVAGEEPRVRIEAWGRPDLAAFERVGWTPAWARFAGSMTLDVVLSGSLATPDRLDLTGTGIVAGLRVDHERLHEPLYVPSGTLSFRGGDMFWTDVSLMAGAHPLQTTGRLNRVPIPLAAMVRALATPWSSVPDAPDARGQRAPVLEAALHGGSLHLDELLGRPPEGGEPTYPQAAFAHLGRRTVGGFGAGVAVRGRGLSRPAGLPVTGSLALDLDTLSLAPFHLTNLSTVLELEPTELVVREAAFEIWGGAADGELVLGMGTGDAEPFQVSLSLDRVWAGDFFSVMTPVGHAIDGVLDLDLTLSGTTERTLLPTRQGLTGTGSLTLEEGRLADTGVTWAVADFLGAETWAEIPFRRWAAQLEIHDSAIEIVDSRLEGPRTDADLAGLIVLDTGANLSLGLSIPPEGLDAISLRRTGVGSDVLEGLRSAGEPLRLGIRISGPLAGPTLEPDATAAAARPR